MLAAPGAVLTGLRAGNDRRARVTLRILDARHVLQALACGSRPGPGLAVVAATVDLTHALSTLGFAAVDRERRRVTVSDAVVAAGWTFVDANIVRHG